MATTVLLLGVPAWSFLEDNQYLFEFFYGTQGLVTGLHASEDITAFLQSLASLPLTYIVGIGVASLAIGLTVYTVLQLVNNLARGASSLFTIARALDPAIRKAARREFEMRAVAYYPYVYCR